ncbi:hypothetical protein EJ04DRAFT_167567 [Polyplosphaeria fusca]|uniref:Uncharacterized protein n=1 Tax=Polyplosphaeria fusca TaxID=682080 RepID=A0A9P4RC37_9PLEO|nr:hypothetical protein EJ04DRAFT_167567 [Polyplosphaeria fusca]
MEAPTGAPATQNRRFHDRNPSRPSFLHRLSIICLIMYARRAKQKSWDAWQTDTRDAAPSSETGANVTHIATPQTPISANTCRSRDNEAQRIAKLPIPMLLSLQPPSTEHHRLLETSTKDRKEQRRGRAGTAGTKTFQSSVYNFTPREARNAYSRASPKLPRTTCQKLGKSLTIV